MLQEKLKTLPSSPGVYFHKDKTGEIIYVGKAAVLKNRVRQYFQSRKDMDTKTLALVKEIADTDWIEVETEMDALFLESEMVKRYMPKFNILLRDDKSATYIRISMNDEVPYVSFTRNPLDDGASYFGPYFAAGPVKKAMRYLRRVFPYYDKPYNPNKLTLDYHIGLTPGMETGKRTAAEYKQDLKKLIRYIQGERSQLVRELGKKMRDLAEVQEFEQAAEVRNQYKNLKALGGRIIFSDKEFLDISKDYALKDLKELLGLEKVPVRIEGYDISHQSGTNTVSSMVVFKNGVADRTAYRKFKIKVDKNDDTANMRETLERRMKHLKDWGRPDLVIIDGGVGQLNAVADILKAEDIAFIGRNKSGDHGKNARVQIVVPVGDRYEVREEPSDSNLAKLVARIDDESHRFAVSYHTVLKRKEQTESVLDEIPGVGPKTKALLKRKIGSVAKIREMDETELAKVVGGVKARTIKQYLG